jgi:hypothetical protein
MLKTAYQLGVLRALQEENLSQNDLQKFAQAFGLDFEKLAVGGILGGLGKLTGKAVGLGAKHPWASHALGGAALGGAAAGLTGGNIGQGALLGGAGGLGLKALGGTKGVGDWFMRGARGSGRRNFMEGLHKGLA